MFVDHTRRTTVGRTPLDEWSARRRDLYLTTHDIHNRQISMPPVGFEPTISAGERPERQICKEPRLLWTVSRLNTSLERHRYTWLPPHSLHGSVPRTELDLVNTAQRPRDDLREEQGMCGAVRGTAGCRWNYWTTVGRSDRLFCDYIQTENIKHFE